MRVFSMFTHLALLGGLATSAVALPSPTAGVGVQGASHEANTNAERIAGGLKGVLKPKRLFDPSKPRALQPRASSVTVPPDSIQIAAGPTGPPSRKRDAVFGGFGVDSDGAVIYTTEGDRFAVFEFANDAKSALQWIATTTEGDFTAGQAYPIYAIADGGIYYVRAGTPPSEAITTIFGNVRFLGDLNPILPVPGQSSTQQFLWITDASTGELILSPDLATASTATEGQASVLLVQYYTYGSTPSLSAAQTNAAQGTNLVNPLYLYARDVAGTRGGYVYRVATQSLFTYGGTTSGTVFYAPALGNGGASQLYTTGQAWNGQAELYAIVGTSTTSGRYGLTAQLSTGTNTTGIIGFNIPSTISGIIDASTAANSHLQLFGTNSGSTFFVACDAAADCGADPSGMYPVCLESVPVGGSAYLCDQQAVEKFSTLYTGKSSLYVYDPSSPSGSTTGYVGIDNSNSVREAGVSIYPTPEAGDYVYFDPATSGQQIQRLYSVTTKSYYTFGMGNNNIGATQLQPDGTFYDRQSQFNLPPDPSQGGLVTAVPAPYLGVSSTSWQFYAGTPYGSPLLFACANSSCEYSYAKNVNPVCVEIVPAGGAPGACAAASAAGETFNPYA